jgi:hypothetical protein
MTYLEQVHPPTIPTHSFFPCNDPHAIFCVSHDHFRLMVYLGQVAGDVFSGSLDLVQELKNSRTRT